MSPEAARKIAALEALAASTQYDGERANALAAIARLREAEAGDEVEDEEQRAWAATMGEAESNRIIADMVRRAYRFLCGRGISVYQDGKAFVIARKESIDPASPGDILTMAVNLGFEP